MQSAIGINNAPPNTHSMKPFPLVPLLVLRAFISLLLCFVSLLTRCPTEGREKLGANSQESFLPKAKAQPVAGLDLFDRFSNSSGFWQGEREREWSRYLPKPF